MPAIKHVWDGVQWRSYSSQAPAPLYGAAPLGSTSYTVPGGALFVSPTGSNSNPGTQALPFLTFEHAAGVVGTGGTIVLRAGVYHTGKTRTTGTSLGYVAVAITAANVTVQNYPGEIVWFDGSAVLTGFVADGATWSRAWTPFRRDPQYSWNSDAAYNTAVSSDNWAPLDGTDPGGNPANDKYWQFVDYTNFPAAARPERVWLDGVQLTQVVTLGALTAGKFFINAQTNKIHLGENPAGKTVEITDLQTCVNFLGDGQIFRGIGVRRFAGSNPQGGVVKFHRASPTVENVHVEDVTPFALDFLGASSNICAHDFIARHVTIMRAGNLGVHVDMCDRGLMERCYLKTSNDKRFAYAPSAGGIKITHARGLTIDRNLFEDSFGKHVWMDIDIYDSKVTRNVLRRSWQRGMVFELSDKCLIAGNLFDETAIDALAPVDCADVRIWNNTFYGAGWRRNNPDTSITDWFSNPRTININRSNRLPHDTASYDMDARDAAGTIPDYPADHVSDVAAPLEFRNNIIAWGDTQQFLADEDFRKNDAPPVAVSAINAGLDPDYNVYQHKTGTSMQFPWNWSNTTSGNTTSTTIAQVRSTWNKENNGTQLTTTVSCVDPITGQLIAAHSSLHAGALALPADIAAAIGQDAGEQHMGCFPLT